MGLRMGPCFTYIRLNQKSKNNTHIKTVALSPPLRQGGSSPVSSGLRSDHLFLPLLSLEGMRA